MAHVDDEVDHARLRSAKAAGVVKCPDHDKVDVVDEHDDDASRVSARSPAHRGTAPRIAASRRVRLAQAQEQDDEGREKEDETSQAPLVKLGDGEDDDDAGGGRADHVVDDRLSRRGPGGGPEVLGHPETCRVKPVSTPMA